MKLLIAILAIASFSTNASFIERTRLSNISDTWVDVDGGEFTATFSLLNSARNLGVAYRTYLADQDRNISFKMDAYVNGYYLDTNYAEHFGNDFLEGAFIRNYNAPQRGNIAELTIKFYDFVDSSGIEAAPRIQFQTPANPVHMSGGRGLVFNNGFIYVPEPETFALFLLGAVGLCVRRQIKANATLPV